MTSEARNIYVDFSKISGDPVLEPFKPPKGTEYLQFQPGSIFSPCSKTADYHSQDFMNHHRLMMNSFLSDQPIPSTYDTIEHPVYLLARDEDCENTFHTMADFTNMFLVHLILEGNLIQQQQLVLFDKYSKGPYFDLIQKAFSPSHPVLRHKDFNKKIVLFRRLIFHLESPAALIHPEVAIPDPLTCYSTGLFHEFRKHVLKAFQLWDIDPPKIPTAVLLLRHRTQHKNVGRVLANEKEVIQVLGEGTMFNYQVIDSASLSFEQQLRIVRQANILIGVHGAGLMLILFAAEECVLLEIHPSYRQDRHFRHATRLVGRTSYTMTDYTQ